MKYDGFAPLMLNNQWPAEESSPRRAVIFLSAAGYTVSSIHSLAYSGSAFFGDPQHFFAQNTACFPTIHSTGVADAGG